MSGTSPGSKSAELIRSEKASTAIPDGCVLPMTTIVGAAGGVTVMVVVPSTVEFGNAADVAVTVTVAGLGTWAGAVYAPPLSIDPHANPEHPWPEIDQVTLWTDDAGCTEAESWRVSPTPICSIAGDTVSETGAGVIVADAETPLPAAGVATMVTCAGFGTVAGAV